MKKIHLLLLLFCVISVEEKGYSQNINTISGITGKLNQVFDVFGNMYYIEDATHINKMDASTGATSRYAGSSTASGTGYSGDNNPATLAKLNDPWYLALNSAGDLFIADNQNHVIRKVDHSTGTITTVAGSIAGFYGDGLSATAAQLWYPMAVAVDGNDDLYISDGGNQRIRKVSHSTGIISTIAGDGTYAFSGDGGPASAAQIKGPYGLSVNPAGTYLYFADLGAHCIRRIDITSGSGQINTVAGTGGSGGYNGEGPATAKKLNQPRDVKFDCDDNMYIADAANYIIRKVDNSGTISTVAGTPGTRGTSGDGSAATSAELWVSNTISIDNIGNLYMPDNGNIRIVCNTYSLPSVTITADPNNCNRSYNGFHATLSSPFCGQLMYEWLINGVTYSSGGSPDYNDGLCVAGYSVQCRVYYSTNEINDFCTSGSPSNVYSSYSNTVYEVGPYPNPVKIAEVLINTICAPGSSGATAPNPQYTAVVGGGTSPYTYSWAPMTGYPTTLDDYTIHNPTILAAASPLIALHRLTVTDVNGCTSSRTIYTPLITSGWDLVTRDAPFDQLDEPDFSTVMADYDFIWCAPDIWNRYTNDGNTFNTNQPPVGTSYGTSLGAPNFLYTKVRNVGCIDYSNVGQDSLSTYWTLGGVGGAEIWPQEWTTQNAPGFPLGTTQPQGRKIGAVQLPSISAGDSVIIEQSWSVPNPQTYALYRSSGVMDLCFLSRIVDHHNGSDPFGMTFPECTTCSPGGNIRNNNNIATFNTQAYAVRPRTMPSPPGHNVLFGNANQGRAATAPLSLQLINSRSLYPGSGTSTLSDFITVKAYLGDLYDVWQTGGSHGTNVVSNSNEKSITFDGSNTLQLDSIRMDSGDIYNIRFEIILNEGANGSEMPEEVIQLRQLVMDTFRVDTLIDTVMMMPIGGYSFTLKYDGSPNPGGVLAISEISPGPAGNCQYAEAIVANCGSDASLYVNVQGWIFDDNTGILDSAGTCDTAHYRLAYDSVWANVQVGSRIVLFNQNANCYNLPDTFTYDDSNHIYWIPIGGTPASPPYGTPHVERYYTTANSSCGYCSDTGITVYDTASDWEHTMHLQFGQDGVQVRCPGCTTERPASPQFYDGVEYILVPGLSDDSLVNIANNIGLVLVAPSGGYNKYVFIGSSYADLLDATKWDVVAADTAGTPPPTAGYVDSAFYLSAFQHTLGLPCCGVGLKGMYENAREKKTTAVNLKVYPNPANSILFFEIPLPIAIGSESNIRIMDITGRVVAQQPVHGELRAGVDVKGFTPGMYIYQVSTGKKVWTGKILVQ